LFLFCFQQKETIDPMGYAKFEIIDQKKLEEI